MTEAKTRSNDTQPAAPVASTHAPCECDIPASRARASESGFTLIEVMVVVAIVAILAAVIVPSFTKESRKSKAASEVGAMFGELAVRQDQYKLENGDYLAASACPSTTASQGQDATSCVTGAWNGLRVRLPQTKLMCSYEIVTGTGTGTSGPNGFVFASPAGEWFYLLATCDSDGSSSVNARYFMSSISQTMQKKNEGA